MGESLSDNAKVFFHVGKISRKPERKRLTELRSRTNKLPKSGEQQELLKRLGAAQKIIRKSAKKNDDRATSVQQTRDLMDQIEPDLFQLEQGGQGVRNRRDAMTFETTPVTKEDQGRAKTLLADVDLVVKELEAQFQPTKGRPGILMQLDPAADGLGRMALAGRAEGIRLAIQKSTVTPTVQKELEDDIEELRQSMVDSETYCQRVRDEAVRIETTVYKQGEDVLDEMRLHIGRKADATPLGEKMAELDAMLHPDLGMLNPVGIKRVAGEVQTEIGIFNLMDPGSYSTGAERTVDDKGKAEIELKAFDEAKHGGHIVGEWLEALYALADPMNQESYGTLSLDTLGVRAGIGVLDPKYPDGAVAATTMMKAIEVEVMKLETERTKLFIAATADIDKLKRQLKTLDATRKKPELALDGKKKIPVYEADWKEIDAMVASITRLMPATADGLTGQGLADLDAIAPLVKAVKFLADSLVAKNDQTSPVSLVGLDTRLTKFRNDLKTAAASGEPLPTYNKEVLKKVVEEADKFIKGLPGMQAKAASDGLKKLETDFAKKLTDATSVRDYIRDSVDPVVIRYFRFWNEVSIGIDLPEPCAQGLALDVIQAECAKQPPDVAKLPAMVTAVVDAFKGIRSAQDLMNETEKSHVVEKQKAKDKKEDDKAKKEPLMERLKFLKDSLDDAAEEVSEAGGDTNLIKQIKRMIEEANVQIKAVAVDKATRLLDRIEQHIDLVQANPMGETARRRKELPDLYITWAKIRDTASENLKTVQSIVESHKPDTVTEKAVARFGRRINAYRKAFATGHGQLRHLIGTLSDPEQPEQARRDAREEALGAVTGLLRGLEAHPLSKTLAQSPIPAARAVPGRLLAGLDRLHFTILTAVA